MRDFLRNFADNFLFAIKCFGIVLLSIMVFAATFVVLCALLTYLYLLFNAAWAIILTIAISIGMVALIFTIIDAVNKKKRNKATI